VDVEILLRRAGLSLVFGVVGLVLLPVLMYLDLVVL
jgi:hypothetical protein